MIRVIVERPPAPAGHDTPARRGGQRFWIALVLVAAVFLAEGLYLARVLVPSHDEAYGLFFGYLTASGQITMFDDGVVGHRAPVPAYVFGATQVLWGRSLLAARLLGVAFGVALVALTGLLGRRLGGDLAGVLAASFLTAQGAIVGYYAIGDFHSLVPAIIVTGLLVFLGPHAPWRNVLGMATFVSLFFVRSHVMPLVPLALAYGLWRATSRVERWVVAAVAVTPPLAFFFSDARHLKLLAHMPLVHHLVRPLGYVPFVYLDARPWHGLESQAQKLLMLGRRYEFFALATVVALALVVWRVRRARARHPYLTNPGINVVAGLFLVMLATLFVAFRINFKWIGMYFASLAPLLAIVLGGLYARLLTDAAIAGWRRRLLAAFVAAMLVLPIAFNRNPLLPRGALRAADPFAAVHVAAAHLARVVPANARVFFFGPLDVYYLAGLPATYLPQITNYDTLAVRDDDNWATLRSGYYGMPQVEAWLGADAEWAVISPQALATFATGFHGHPETNVPKVARIKALLARHFERVDVVDEYPYYAYEVYRRARP